MNDPSLNGQNPIIKELPLNMVLDLNIQNQKPISFTSSMFTTENGINTSGFAEYPFFSQEILYPKVILKELSYQEQLNFFFKKNTFLETLKNTEEYNTKLKSFINKKREMDEQYREYTSNSGKTERKIKEKTDAFEKYKKLLNDVPKIDFDKRNRVCRQNIMIMLLLLFPVKTYEPTINTFDSIFLNKLSSSFSISGIMPILISIFIGIKYTEEKYAYLRIPGKNVCTVTRLVWTNDIYNHPEYKKLTDYYNKYNEWKLKERIKQDTELTKKFNRFKRLYVESLQLIGEYQDVNPDERRYYYERNNNDTKSLNQLKESAITISNGDEFDSLIYLASLMFIQISATISIQSIEQFVLKKNRKFNIRALTRDLEELIRIYEIIKYIDGEQTIDIVDTENSNSFQQREIQARNQRLKQWSGNEEVNKFVELVKQIQKQESSNIFLQTAINQFIKKPDPNDLDPRVVDLNIQAELEELMFPENSRNEEYVKYIETGVSFPQKSNATIYLQLDVIEGKVDDMNKSKISCSFNREYLGIELENLLKPQKKFWKLDDNRFGFNMNTETAVILDENKNIVNSSYTPTDDKPVIPDDKPVLKETDKNEKAVLKETDKNEKAPIQINQTQNNRTQKNVKV